MFLMLLVLILRSPVRNETYYNYSGGHKNSIPCTGLFVDIYVLNSVSTQLHSRMLECTEVL